MTDDIQEKIEKVLGHAADQGAIPEAGLLGRIIDKISVVFAISLIVSMLILINEIVMRYVFNAPTSWAHETTIFIVGMAFIFGGLYCVARNQHIRVVLVYDYVPASIRRVLDVFISHGRHGSWCNGQHLRLMALSGWKDPAVLGIRFFLALSKSDFLWC